MTPEPDIVYMDASLTPNRSLSPKAFLIVMCIIGGVSFIGGLVFMSMGAFPVLGFFGLDALAIWLAFRYSFKRQHVETRVKVTAAEIELQHYRKGALEKSARIPTLFSRVTLDFPDRRPSELKIAHGQKAWVIGQFLTPWERKSFKRALDDAIRKARSERFATE